jgi:hypothetical protein
MGTIAALADVLQTTFASAAVESNQVARVVKRVRKFDPVSLALTFTLGLLENPRAGADDVADMAATLGVDITPQAVSQRYGPELRTFFETLFEKMVQVVVRAEQPLAAILDRFTEVRLIDSSVIALPVSQADRYRGGGVKGGHVKSALKLQTELNLKSGQIQGIQIEPGRQPDQATDRQHVRPQKGSLRITDLGYFNLAVFAMIHAADAYFLSRTQHTVSVQCDRKAVNLVTWLFGQGVNVVDQEVVLGTKNRLRCRLIAWKVPPQIENSRRRKLRQSMKDRGRAVSKQALQSCTWEYLITNLSEEQLSVREAIILYRSRWQIELLFKRWKSCCQIDRLDGLNDEIKMTRLWIRLCAAILQHWLIVVIGWPEALKISFAKLASLIGKMARELARHLDAPKNRLVTFLERMRRHARRRCRRTKRKQKPGTIELLNDPELLEYCLT